MIEFRGEFSDACKKHMVRQDSKIGFFVGLVTIVLFMIPTIIATILWDKIVAIAIPFLILIPILLGCPLTNSTKKAIGSQNVLIGNGIIESHNEKTGYYNKIEDVKKVVDYGEFYQIYLNFPHRLLGVICQKDLIVQGTIEEFEELFADKIVRKIKG